MSIDRGRLHARGFDFDYLEAGPTSGPLVLLLHGFPQSSECWRPALSSLGDAGFHAVAPDQRGYSPGAAPSDVAAYRVSELVDDVLAMGAALGTGRFHLVGHDWGGTVAWTVASQHPDSLLSLTVLSTPQTTALRRALRGFEQQARMSYVAVLQLPRVVELLTQTAGGAIVERALVATGLPRTLARRDIARLRRVGASGALNWYRALRLGGTPRGSVVGVRTLYVWSNRDVAFSRAAAESSEEHVDAPYHFVELDGASHWIPDLNWSDIDDLVLEHLGPARPRRAASSATHRTTTKTAAVR